MVWWVTTLKWLFGIICVAAFFAAFYFVLSIITKTRTKRRYKPENDIGRKRTEFSNSLSGPGQAPGVRMELPNLQPGDMENAVVEAVGPTESESRGASENPSVQVNTEPRRLEDFDYERFRKEKLN